MKRDNHHTNLVPFAGSYKPVVGIYDISQLWYRRQKFENANEPTLVSKPTPNASDHTNEDELDEVANGIPFSTSDDDWTWKTAALPEVWKDGKILSIITMVLCMKIRHYVN